MNSAFRIFFLCEDWSSVNRANELKSRLAENCRDHVVIEADFCEYARLCHPRLRETAMTKAINSDMIIISAHGTEAMPGFVRDWLNKTGESGEEKTAYAEFLHADSPDKATTFHSFMDNWVSKRGAQLFSNLFPTLEATS
jgi:hypothetical protein